MSPHSGLEFAAVLAAGGSGSRFSSGSTNEPGKAKQFLELHGRPLYWWSLFNISKHHLVRRIILVAPSAVLELLSDEAKSLCEKFELRQQLELVAGGETRQESVFKALSHIKDVGEHPDFVLIHDAARPFLDFETVERVIKHAIEYDACTVGAPVSDTVKRVVGDKVLETIPREQLVAVQTPQAGRFGNLLSAHIEARQLGFNTTDDAALLEWAGHEVRVVPGPAYNLKITQPLDLVVSQALGDYLLKDPL
ncbi:MAG: 2-C-methyl-D-erythritol 4-phosphate cytidylyltransferase [Candidatus Obscuribacterales bacterium]|jgi:2-C-methyl-D-erythritol 4-phosphate cytidylyltransferase|nr:2-C-methyl-D-erythritol 4-phosphate cytidylyltransferase [Candidatus Obscuribacterales bacterium]